MFISIINIISKPLVCAADSSSSRISIQLNVALGGRYAVYIRKGLEFGKVISAQMVSSFDNWTMFKVYVISKIQNYTTSRFFLRNRPILSNMVKAINS